MCDPSSCGCDIETEVAWIGPNADCCPICHDVTALDCTKCTGGYTTLLDSGSCRTCNCYDEGGFKVEVCKTSTDATVCSKSRCYATGYAELSCADCPGSRGYFDGCNSCICGENDTSKGGCTKMSCAWHLEEPYCYSESPSQSPTISQSPSESPSV